MTDYSLFPDTPYLNADSDPDSVSVGTEFYVTAPAWVTDLRFLQPATGGDMATRIAALYQVNPDGTGTLVAGPLSISTGNPGDWAVEYFSEPYRLTPGTRYRAVVFHPGGHYAATGHYFEGTDRIYGPIVVPSAANATAGVQGSYLYGGSLAFPVNHFNAATYYSGATITDTDPNAPPPPDAPGIIAGSLDPQPWAGTLPAAARTGTLEPRRWAGTL